MREGMEFYKLTAEVEAILLDDYGRENGTMALAIGTIFRVNADEGTVGEHPGVIFNGIVAANGKRYRVEAAALVGRCEKLAPKGE